MSSWGKEDQSWRPEYNKTERLDEGEARRREERLREQAERDRRNREQQERREKPDKKSW